MNLRLIPHPQVPAPAIQIEARAVAAGRQFDVVFAMTGDIADITLPPPSRLGRTNGLWQHTCFEIFLAAESGYLEFNLSPSGQWAAYRFSGYREGMSDVDVPGPRIAVLRSDLTFQLTASIVLPRGDASRRLGISAVVEQRDGTKSYWALRHPPKDKPDFHHPDCFAIELPAPSAP